MTLTRDDAMTRDAQDALARFRDEFVFAEAEEALIYLDGNSLGRLPKRTQAVLRDVVDRQWGERLIRSWNEGWFTAAGRIGDKVAQLVGAGPGEVVMADSTSVNLFKLVVAALRSQPGRARIVTDDLNFPSDLYILQGAIDLLGGQHELVVVRSRDGMTVGLDELAAVVDERTALVTLSAVVFKSGFMYDMAAVNALARQAGALTLWDLSHAVGAVEIDLAESGADLAVGCTYKYLNGGPGAPAFLWVRPGLQGQLQNPVSGWFGQRDPFAFGLDYIPTPGVNRFLTGTPPVLSLLAVEAGVDLLLEAGMAALRAKSVAQTEYLIALWEQKLAALGFRLNTPIDAAQRGSHVSLGHEDGLAIDLALIVRRQVLPDFRAPESIRLGIAPIYTRYVEIFDAVDRMAEVVRTGEFRAYRNTRPAVS